MPKELSSGFQLVDNFSNHFYFYSVTCKNKEIKDVYIHNLDKILKDSLSDPKTVIVISDTSIKKNVATSVSHICSGYNILAKTIYHTVNVTSIKVELFAIRCDINQAVQVKNATNIIVITDAIYATRWIFNLFPHPYQLQSIAIA